MHVTVAHTISATLGRSGNEARRGERGGNHIRKSTIAEDSENLGVDERLARFIESMSGDLDQAVKAGTLNSLGSLGANMR